MKQEKIPLSRRMGVKITAAILAFVLTLIAVGSCIAVGGMFSEEIYTIPQEDYRKQFLGSKTINAAYVALREFGADWDAKTHDALDDYFDYTNIVAIKVKGPDGERSQWGNPVAGEAKPYRSYFKYAQDMQTLVFADGDFLTDNWSDDLLQDKDQMFSVDVYISKDLTVKDGFYWADLLVRAAYALRYWIYPIALASIVGAVWCFVFLVRSAGMKKGKEGVQPWLVTKIPGDLWYCAAGIGSYLLVGFTYEMVAYNIGVVGLLVGVPMLFYLFLFLCMEISVRCKVGGFWKHTVLYRFGRWLLQVARRVGCLMKDFIRQIPLIWKTLTIYVAISLLNLLLLFMGQGEMWFLFLGWIIESVVLLVVVLGSALMMRKLQKAGQALAEGDMGHQVDTSKLILDFKEHGENLNHISEGMAIAVEQRMKSERMKTELITNVSHDIKTPLTSIINYSDLICQEECDNEKIGQYADVLHRQSERLKRLIEDLVEASKASTGNIEINLAPCDVGVMLTQAVGEYEEKVEQANLQMITKKPDSPIKIMADGRRLWRILDNLMINICKYAQPGTRVYLTLDEKDGKALISFKNISRAVLDISPDELTERFVRGDSSRKSEGNGLGLSIAKSLTELQGGNMELFIDGDLFKVVLSFPVMGA